MTPWIVSSSGLVHRRFDPAGCDTSDASYAQPTADSLDKIGRKLSTMLAPPNAPTTKRYLRSSAPPSARARRDRSEAAPRDTAAVAADLSNLRRFMCMAGLLITGS